MDGAAVRVAMTVGARGNQQGLVQTVVSEAPGQDFGYDLVVSERSGTIRPDLTIGADISECRSLKSNESLSNTGVKLHGAGFILTPNEAIQLGINRITGLDLHIRRYRNGKDIAGRSRDALVIDLEGLSLEEVKTRFPEVYQHVLLHVKPERDSNNERYRRENWWLFGRKNTELRKALEGLRRYIATVETSKHRFFVFLEESILPDNKLVNVALEDAFFLGVLSSRIHVVWSMAVGSRLEDRPVYVKTTCFDAFPFPKCDEGRKTRIRALAESLDAHRKRQQSQHPNLTLTEMYNVLVKLRTEEPLTAKERIIHEQGLVSLLKQIHDDLDAAVFNGYGWPHALSDHEILARVVDLNHSRFEEEKRGLVRWLRPEFQNPAGARSVTMTQAALPIEAESDELETTSAKIEKKLWPKTMAEQAQSVRAALSEHPTGLSAKQLAGLFVRAKPARVVELLETLTSLGQARLLDDNRYVP